MEIKTAQCQSKQNTVPSDRNLVLTCCNKGWKPIKVIAGKLYDPKTNPFVTSSRHWTEGTPSPIRKSLTCSSLALGSESEAGHIWDMYSGCQHEASHMKLWMESLLPRKMRRSREKCPETPVQRGRSRQRHCADGRTGEGKEEFVPFVPGLAWEGWSCLRCTQEPKIAHSDNSDCAAGSRAFLAAGEAWMEQVTDKHLRICFAWMWSRVCFFFSTIAAFLWSHWLPFQNPFPVMGFTHTFEGQLGRNIVMLISETAWSSVFWKIKRV